MSKETRYSEEQKRAITTIGKPMLVVAGPGSGKTTVITERIKYLIESAGINPADILVITFTRAAAKEMQTRFAAKTAGEYHQVRFGTFHSIFYWIIKTAYNLNNSSIITDDEKKIWIGKLIHSMGLSYDNEDDIIASVMSQVSYIKCDMIDVDNYYSRDMPEETFRELYRRLEEQMRREGRIDFDDMMVLCYELLVSRKDILRSLQNIFKYILVDEFQDSNKLQYEILKLLSGYADNVYVVGDDDQSVYGFRGARPEIMQQFKKDYKGCIEVVLGKNYRCDRMITEASSAVISKNKNRFTKSLTANSEADGVVKLFEPKDIKEENDIIINMIMQRYKNNIPYEEQAVLFRTNIQPRRLVYKLEQFNIPYSLSDMMPNIFQHFAVKNILDYMHVAMGDHSRSTFLRIMNKPGRYIKRELLLEDPVDYDKLRWRLRDKEYVVERLDKLVADLKLMSKLKPYAAVNFIRNFMGYDAYLKEYAEYRQLDVTEFYDVLDDFAAILSDMESFGELFLFVDEYEEILKKQQKNKSAEKRGVNLMTMHSSKGLEFDCVYIIDAVEGITPYKKAKSPAELEEERRMFYVAMTRARHELYIFSPKLTTGDAKDKSRYIEDIERVLADKNCKNNNLK